MSRLTPTLTLLLTLSLFLTSCLPSPASPTTAYPTNDYQTPSYPTNAYPTNDYQTNDYQTPDYSTPTPAPPLPEMPFENRLFQQGETYILEYHDDRTNIQYRYTPSSGSLHDLQVIIAAETPFFPSNYGGPRFWVNGEDLPIWETEPDQFTYTARIVDNTVLEVNWQAHLEGQTIPYTYRFSIRGKTLRLEVTSPSTALAAFTLDRSEETPGGRILSLPYLPLFSLLLYRQHFLSAYFDWQETHASRLEPMNETISAQSLAFSQTAYYLPNTNGDRQPLHEVIYLTVSNKLDEVLPILPARPSPYHRLLAGKALLDLWAERSFAEDARLIKILAQRGVSDLIVVRHNWQRCGFDDCYPNVLPANLLWGGDAGLEELSRAAHEAGYLFALHENYVDMYPNAADFSTDLLALTPEGQPVPAWFNHTTGTQSFLLAPTRSVEVASRFSPEIHRRYDTNALYLDVSTAVHPSEKVDYNAAAAGHARLATTQMAYRQLLEYERQTHQSPVIGEGGHHLLYAGAVDGVLAEDPGRQQAGTGLPPIVNFDLTRIHPYLVSFGMGFYPWFFGEEEAPKWYGYTAQEHYRYMAYEIAFCHGAYLPTPDSLGQDDQAAAFIEQEVRLVASVHRHCALAQPLRILYHVNGEMTGVERALLEDQPWQIFVEYDNGLHVWVNLHPTETWQVSLTETPSWICSSSLMDGERRDFVGSPPQTSSLLPPNGWLVAKWP